MTASLIIESKLSMKKSRSLLLSSIQKSRHDKRSCLREQGGIFPEERDHLGMCAAEDSIGRVWFFAPALAVWKFGWGFPDILLVSLPLVGVWHTVFRTNMPPFFD